jgi:hypothetical protein
MEVVMSLPLLNAVLASHLGKSSTRFALAILAYRACSRCGRVYLGITSLANQLNVDVRNAKALLAKLREEKYIEPTGELTLQGTIVYRLQGVMLSSPDDSDRADFDTGEVMKSCRFCRQEVMPSSPNRQKAYRQEKDTAGRSRAKRTEDHCHIDGCDRPTCAHQQLCAYHGETHCLQCAGSPAN